MLELKAYLAYNQVNLNQGNTLVASEDFRRGMAKFATGVTLFTTVDDEDKVHAMTANALTSVCLDPPLVLVCVAHSSNSYGFVERRGRFGTSILRDDQRNVGEYYAQNSADRDGKIGWSFVINESGYPVLEGALAFFGCKVVSSYVHGDHTIYVAEVEELSLFGSGQPLLFFDSHFKAISGDG